MTNNIILQTDSYKLSHYRQYPPQTDAVYSYFESRGGKYPSTLFFGLQYFLKNYLEGTRVTMDSIAEAEEIAEAHFGSPYLFNRPGWEHIVNHHDGRLPVSIKAVPEGTLVNNRNVLMTVENTGGAPTRWLTNYLETLLVQVWYPCTVATVSHAIRKVILEHLEATGDPSLIDFMLHDFGFRGVSSTESAGIGGLAHLVNFKGTDTIEALMIGRRFYGERMAGFSIPAAEHSTITSWGREGEYDAYRNMLRQYPTGPLAIVVDSYDPFHACDVLFGQMLHREIMHRDGKLVVRPDSGDPVRVIGRILAILGEKFGYLVNDKGFRVLHPKVRIIQGDGVDIDSISAILTSMKAAGWSADNICFGMGGALLQKLNRDTQRFAFKCSAIQINGEWHDVYKDPITDPGKTSKRGRLRLIKGEQMFRTERLGAGTGNELVEVFRDGEVLVEHALSDIRKRAGAVTKAAPAVAFSGANN